MDPLCHTLTGASLSAAGLRRAGPLATVTLILAANAPDADVLVYTFADEFAGLAYRRGITHGLPALVLWPFVVTRFVVAWDRVVRRRRTPEAPPPRPRALLLLAFLGVLTHPALDWLNNYGMRWLAPLHGAWSYGDAVFIVDPWMWLALGAAVYLSRRWPAAGEAGWVLLAGLASVLIATSPFVPAGARAAWVLGLAAVLAARFLWRGGGEEARTRLARRLTAAVAGYVAAMVALAAAGRAEALRAAGAAGLSAVEDVMVAPVPADPLGGQVLVATPSAYRHGTLRWTRTPRVVLEDDSVPRLRVPASVDGARWAVERALEDPRVRHFLTWSRYPFFDVREETDWWWVRVGDARYARSAGTNGLGGLRVRVRREPP